MSHGLNEGDTGTAAAVPLFLLSTAPKDLDDDQRRALRSWADGMSEAFEPCPIPDIGGTHSPCFVDAFSALANDSLGIAGEFGSGDGINLNDAGHAETFRVAEPIVRGYVCRRTACS